MLIMLIMCSGSQVLLPFLLGIVFAVWKRNLIAWGICWAWSANAMCDAEAVRRACAGRRRGYVAPVGPAFAQAKTLVLGGLPAWFSLS